ncbi:nuclease [Nitrospira sp. KM1]|nr:nuclease [Nitrospira sp. KM1]
MTVVAIAYDRLNPKARTAIDELLRENDLYEAWVRGVAADDQPKAAFMRAATWPDLIKNQEMGYQNDGNLPNGPEANRNIGYADKLMHRYWHFIDIPFSPDNMAVPKPDVPNVQTQIATFRTTLKDPKASKDVKSYDLVWLIHLVGDVHQPLHATTRFDQQLPQGDRGGNDVNLCIQPTVCNGRLHAFWDDVLGTSESYEPAMAKANSLSPVEKELGMILDEAVWVEESFQAAKAVAYAFPVGAGAGPYTLDDAYKTAARELAEQRVALAGVRLANVLNDIFE